MKEILKVGDWVKITELDSYEQNLGLYVGMCGKVVKLTEPNEAFKENALVLFEGWKNGHDGHNYHSTGRQKHNKNSHWWIIVN